MDAHTLPVRVAYSTQVLHCGGEVRIAFRAVRLLAFLTSFAAGMGCGSGSQAPATPRSGRSGTAIVPGGVDAKSANYRFIGGTSAASQVSSSPSYRRFGGVLAATQ